MVAQASACVSQTRRKSHLRRTPGTKEFSVCMSKAEDRDILILAVAEGFLTNLKSAMS